VPFTADHPYYSIGALLTSGLNFLLLVRNEAPQPTYKLKQALLRKIHSSGRVSDNAALAFRVAASCNWTVVRLTRYGRSTLGSQRFTTY